MVRSEEEIRRHIAELEVIHAQAEKMGQMLIKIRIEELKWVLEDEN